MLLALIPSTPIQHLQPFPLFPPTVCGQPILLVSVLFFYLPLNLFLSKEPNMCILFPLFSYARGSILQILLSFAFFT